MKLIRKAFSTSRGTSQDGEGIPILRPVLSASSKFAAMLAGDKQALLKATGRMALFGFLFVAMATWSVGLRPILAISETDLIRTNPDSNILKDPSYDEEILWFARLIYSETKDVKEQVYVAWVARNRVENGFRGHTYKDVALSPNQFSGLNAFDRNYAHNVNLDYNDDVPGWKTAIEVAKLVYDAPEVLRPFESDVMHFYSPTVVRAPSWALGREAVHEIKDHYGRVRFAFYRGVR